MTVVLLICFASGCAKPTRSATHKQADETEVTSNVLRADYAGSASCAPCHTAIHERWTKSPMHRMTRLADGAAVRAPFAGHVFHFQGHQAEMMTADAQRYMRLRAPDGHDDIYRVTKVIGGRYREDYAGVRVREPSTRAPALSTELVLPVTFDLKRSEWRYKGYSVMVPERPAMMPGPTWNRTCIFCHNTPPRVAKLYDDLLGPSAPTYQGSIPSNLLPENRKVRYLVHDQAGLADAVREEVSRFVSTTPSDLEQTLHEAIKHTGRRFGESDLVELGIGCEACHGGARVHAENPNVLPSYGVKSTLFSVQGPQHPVEPSRAEWINRSCAECHAVLFSRYAPTWEGGQRRGNAGGSHINSGEARDYLLGGCASAMACTSCHDPHAEDDPAQLRLLGSIEGNTLCTSCHRELSGKEALARHSHHEPSGAGASCVGCHMPRKNLSLDHKLTRYHRIGSPTDAERVERDRPLECALCHVESSVGSLIESMEQWWDKRYDRSALTRLYGPELEVNALVVTLREGKAHEQAVAIARLGETGQTEHLPLLVQQLDHPYPLVRYVVRESLQSITHSLWPLDMSLPGARLRAEGEAWLRQRHP